jgi:hypothetical protein
MQHQQERQLVALVVLEINMAQEQEVHLRLPIQVEQVAVALAILLLAVMLQATQAELAETAVVVAEGLTTLEHQALAALALFIFITKENKWQRMQ